MFCWRARVYWEDTDGGGVVYYANYLKFMERARTEWLRSLGHSQSELASQYGYVFAVAEVNVNYRKPARLDDELSSPACRCPKGACRCVSSRPSRAATCSSTEGEVRVACVDAKTFRPRSLPEFINLKVSDGQ